ncbi:MAG TPA: hypothetical protein VI968_01560 [archaeon]|nr:hypothetical protein [archaeon]
MADTIDGDISSLPTYLIPEAKEIAGDDAELEAALLNQRYNDPCYHQAALKIVRAVKYDKPRVAFYLQMAEKALGDDFVVADVAFRRNANDKDALWNICNEIDDNYLFRDATLAALKKYGD